jgi:hypothetical protein
VHVNFGVCHACVRDGNMEDVSDVEVCGNGGRPYPNNFKEELRRVTRTSMLYAKYDHAHHQETMSFKVERDLCN